MNLVIRSWSERGFWSNEDGWVYDVESATKFPDRYGNLPMARGGDAEFILTAAATDFEPD